MADVKTRSETYPIPKAGLELEVYTYLRSHNQKLFRELSQAGDLNEFCHKRAQESRDLLGSLVEQGTPYWEARETADRLLYPPSEEERNAMRDGYKD